MTDRIKLEWQPPDVYGVVTAVVPAKESGMGHVGHYKIHACPRPAYCDRGQWHVLVEEVGVYGLDGQEGFPCYYFRLETLKQEIEDWVNKRETCLRAKDIK